MTATNDQILAAINAMNSRVQQGLLALQSQLGWGNPSNGSQWYLNVAGSGWALQNYT